ncbi:MAG: RpiB/LacA/LacB family sugar-phosphate isomerase [bacterium]
MKVFIGTDHAGFELKETLKTYLSELGYDVSDKGAFQFDAGDDYPDFVQPVAEIVGETPESFGIVLGKSGQGEAMCANRFKGIKCAVYYGGDLEIVKLEREHNNANILSLGAQFVTPEIAKEAVKLFLETKFSGEERHVRRLAKIDSVL